MFHYEFMFCRPGVFRTKPKQLISESEHDDYYSQSESVGEHTAAFWLLAATLNSGLRVCGTQTV